MKTSLPEVVDDGWIGRRAIQPLVDVLAMVTAAALLVFADRYAAVFDGAARLAPLAIVVDVLLGAAMIAFFRLRGHYDGRKSVWRDGTDILLAMVAALLVEAAIMFFGRLDGASRLIVVDMWLLAGLLVFAGRQLSRAWLVRRGTWTLPVVIVGTGETARDLAQALADAPDATYAPIAFASAFGPASRDGSVMLGGGRQVPVIGLGGDAFELVRRFGRVRVVVALEAVELANARILVDRLKRSHRSVEVVLPVRGMPVGRAYQTRYASHDLTLIKLERNLGQAVQATLKRWFDILAVSAILVLVAPLFGILSLLVLTSGRPVFFAHERIGRHGVPFKCLKFRTMATDAHERLQAILATDPEARAEWLATRKLKHDPRITPIGHWLRKTSLDEIPQLFNALRGEMSLVGPRPVTFEEVEQYGDSRGYYMDVRPGITGLWQVSGRNDVDFERRVHLDAWYTQNWSLRGDVNILFMTLRVVLLRQGAY